MEEIFKNETNITAITFKIMMLCRKFHNRKLEYGIKFLMCISIIILVFFANLVIEDKIFCLVFAILGIADIIKLEEKRIQSVTKLKYSFFLSEFKVSNGFNSVTLKYNDIEEIIKTRRYCFFQIRDYIFAIDTKGFKIGNSNDLIEFIINKVQN